MVRYEFPPLTCVASAVFSVLFSAVFYSHAAVVDIQRIACRFDVMDPDDPVAFHGGSDRGAAGPVIPP